MLEPSVTLDKRRFAERREVEILGIHVSLLETKRERH